LPDRIENVAPDPKRTSDRHNFPQDFPSPDVASGLMSFLLAHPNFYSTVAEFDGRIVGSNFLDERSQIAGVGPISVDPNTQTRGIGRQLMEDVLGRSRERAFEGVRLVQAGYNNQTLCLYTKIFRPRCKRDQRRHDGADWCGREYYWAWHTGADAQPCALHLVFEKQLAAQSADDPYEYRPLLRAIGHLPAISALLNGRGRPTSAFWAIAAALGMSAFGGKADIAHWSHHVR
jgi:GNAT superfamily N-acetyltransferase